MAVHAGCYDELLAGLRLTRIFALASQLMQMRLLFLSEILEERKMTLYLGRVRTERPELKGEM